MVTQADTCLDETDSQAISVAAAREQILKTVHATTASEQIPLRQALGRVSFADIPARIDSPPFTNSAMDGYAIRLNDSTTTKPFRLLGDSLAGHPYTGKLKAQQAIRITTGALLPRGADTVVMQEFASQNENGQDVLLQRCGRVGDFVRKAGSDLAKGETLVQKGKRLRPSDLGMLAAQGIAEIQVYQRPRVAFFSTGDELIRLGKPLPEGGIYDSNRYCLHGLLEEMGAIQIDLGVVKDDIQALGKVFSQAQEVADLVISTGGVSVGPADFIKTILDDQGTVNFWKIAMRPGRPLTFGCLNQAYFFGLPGNPVSVQATFDLFLRDALRTLEGETFLESISLQAQSASNLSKNKGRRDFQRGFLHQNSAGQLCVLSTGAQGSHRMTSVSKANCYIVLDEQTTQVKIGEMVEVIPFRYVWS